MGTYFHLLNPDAAAEVRVLLLFDVALLSMVKSTIKFIVPQPVSEKTQGYTAG